ncbi:hypothetical protein RI367_008026 [Sorochytrium milnesiophthora]
MSSSNLVALVTGANRGIGLALVKELRKQAASLVMQLDAGSETSINALPAQLDKAGIKQIDLLINNAAMATPKGESLASLSMDSVLQQFAVNSVGPILVTRTLLPYLRASVAAHNGQPPTRVVQVTSRFGSIADNTSGGSYAYRASKSALNMLNKCLSIDLKKDNIAAVALHPGHVVTRMGGAGGDIQPDECAARMLQTLSKFSLDDTGKFYHRDGQIIPW